MLEVILKSFETPDETRVFEKGKLEIVQAFDVKRKTLSAVREMDSTAWGLNRLLLTTNLLYNRIA
jgi:hypothetical protein